MTNEDIYEIWRPANSPWSQWVKPVVFPFLRPQAQGRDDYSIRDWQILLCPDAVVIADLPGAEGVSAAIAMARSGYRPVLMYNACPNAGFDGVSPELGPEQNAEPASPPVVVDMSSILTALCATAKELASLPLSEGAPPVFLLDGNRRGFRGEPGWFDNRSFVASSDFPSADYFRGHGISRVILIQPASRLNTDLLYVLLSLQREGLTIATQAPWEPWAPRPLIVEAPVFLVSAWEWLCRRFGYRRNGFHSSFGGLIPHSSS
jgi:hypothetical protein